MGKKYSKRNENDRKLIEDILKTLKSVMNIKNDSDFEKIETLVKDSLVYKSPSSKQSRNDLDYILS